ncbi:MAG: type II toxin-antitoxin system RelE/ParE family toxin [Bacteroidales bacterium]|nr:type II toxin-antitoxin system RelE/ParE family toxin [Bacteroidales bacterium]
MIWLTNAQEALLQTAEYVGEIFGEKKQLELLDEVELCNKLLSQHPFMGRMEPELADRTIEYRYLIVKRLNKIIYNVDNDIIVVADFWNTRRNPKKLVKGVPY